MAKYNSGTISTEGLAQFFPREIERINKKNVLLHDMV